MIKSHHRKGKFLTYFYRLVVSKQTSKIWIPCPRNSQNWKKIVFNSLLEGRKVVRYYSCAIRLIWTHFNWFQSQKSSKQCSKWMTSKRWQKKRFKKRQKLSKPEKAQFCISKNIRWKIWVFKNNVCSWFFDFFIFYANSNFDVKRVRNQKWLIFLDLDFDIDCKKSCCFSTNMLYIYGLMDSWNQ